MVDIIFDSKAVTKKQLVYNEIYSTITEKKKIIDPCERSVFQLLEQYKENDSDNRATKKAHGTMLKKNYSVVFRTFGVRN